MPQKKVKTRRVSSALRDGLNILPQVALRHDSRGIPAGKLEYGNKSKGFKTGYLEKMIESDIQKEQVSVRILLAF